MWWTDAIILVIIAIVAVADYKKTEKRFQEIETKLNTIYDLKKDNKAYETEIVALKYKIKELEKKNAPE